MAKEAKVAKVALSESQMLRQMDAEVWEKPGESTLPGMIDDDIALLPHEIEELGYGPQDGDERLTTTFEEIPEKLGLLSKSRKRSVFGPTLIVRISKPTVHGRGDESVQIVREDNQDYWKLRFPKEWSKYLDQKANPVLSQLSLAAFQGANFITSMLRQNLEGARIPNVKKLSQLSNADIAKLEISGLTVSLRDSAKSYVKLVESIGVSE